MKNKFLELGFKEVGHFIKNNDKKLDLVRVNVNYNSSNVVWLVITKNELLYVGETINEINDVVKDLEKGNKNRQTRNKIHLLIGEFILKNEVYLFVDDLGVNSKQDLIKEFAPIGNSFRK